MCLCLSFTGPDEAVHTLHSYPGQSQPPTLIAPVHHQGRNQYKEDRQDDRQDIKLVFILDEKVRETDTYSVGLSPVRVAVLEAVGLLLLVCEALVTL